MVNIVGENAEKLQRSKKLQEWLGRFNPRFVRIVKIEEGWSLWKGKDKDELIFALLFLRCLDENGKEKGDVVFYRSNASAVFLVFKDKATGKKYVVLVEQLRIPSGTKLLEMPAGSVEDKDDFLETIIREVEEEVGFKITGQKQDSIIFLGEYFLSPGACNEKIALYSCEIDLEYQEIKELQDAFTGTPGEDIRVRIFPLEDFEKLNICDAKTRLSYELYRRKGGN